jgi:hypothetical protein
VAKGHISLWKTLHLSLLLFKPHFILQRLNAAAVNGVFNACHIDLCGVENDEKLVQKLKCDNYAKINELCLAFAARHNIRDWVFNWRASANCRKRFFFFLFFGLK